MHRKVQKNRLIGLAALLLAVVVLACGLAQAEVTMITPVTATAQSSFTGDGRTPDKTIDGSGMMPSSPVTAASTADNGHVSKMWLSDGTRETWITFDLGTIQHLTGFHLWNGNENNNSGRSIKTAEIYVGTNMLASGTAFALAGPAWGTLVEDMTFAKASGLPGYAGEDYAFANTVTGRYIQVYVTANHNNDTSYTGISEIRFYTDTARSANDQFISPTTATAQSYYSGGAADDVRSPGKVFDGSGMTPNAPVRITSIAGNIASTMWLNNNTNKTWITFDLGAVQKVTGFRLWNYNEYSGNPVLYTKSGVKSASLYAGDTLPPNGMTYASAGPAWGRFVADFGFRQATGSAALEGFDHALAAPVIGRYIQLYITDSFGNNAAGLAEIAFYSSTRYEAASPIAVTAQSYHAPDNRAPVTAINGAGMTPNNPVTTSSLAGNVVAGNMWLSSGTTDTWITFDLGTEQSVAGFHLWNYNENNKGTDPSYTGRGIKTAGIYTGSSLLANSTAFANAGPIWGTLVTNMTFKQASGAAGDAGADYFVDNVVTSRYVQVYVTSNYGKDAYTGLSEIMFYSPMRDLTRLSSGDKVIGDSGTESYRVIEGTGSAGALTLGAATTFINTLFVAVTEAPVVVDLPSQALALTKIQLQGGAGGLTLGTGSNNGTLKSRNTYLVVDNQSTNPVTINSVIADGSGPSSLTQSGRGTVILTGANTYSGSTTVNASTLRIEGGTLNNSAINLNAGTLQLAGGSSVTASQVALNMGLLGSLSFDGGTLAAASGASALNWIGAGNTLRIANNGAVIDTANASVGINRPLLQEGVSTGGLTKIGANTLTLTAPCTYAGATEVQGGTLKLAPPAALIHYSFDNAHISGTTVQNLGMGGAAYNGVINGTPATGVAGVAGEAVTLSATGQGVVTANSVSLANGFTYAAWVKSNGSAAWSQRTFNNDHMQGGYLGTSGANTFQRYIKSISLVSTQASDDTINWHHIAMTWDGATNILYYDGAPIQTNLIAGVNAALAFKIGVGNNPTPNGEFWNGSMDEAYVFDRALTAAEMAGLKNLSLADMAPLPTTTDLKLNNNATLELNGVNQTVTTLTLNGVLRARGDSTWGAPGSGADHTSSQFTGTGVLRVLGPPAQGTIFMIE